MIWFFAALCGIGLVLGRTTRMPALLVGNGIALLGAAACAAELGWTFWPGLGVVLLAPFILDLAYLAGLALQAGPGRPRGRPGQAGMTDTEHTDHRRTERADSERKMLSPEHGAAAWTHTAQTLPSCFSSTGMVRRTIWMSLRKDHP